MCVCVCVWVCIRRDILFFRQRHGRFAEPQRGGNRTFPFHLGKIKSKKKKKKKMKQKTKINKKIIKRKIDLNIYILIYNLNIYI